MVKQVWPALVWCSSEESVFVDLDIIPGIPKPPNTRIELLAVEEIPELAEVDLPRTVRVDEPIELVEFIVIQREEITILQEVPEFRPVNGPPAVLVVEFEGAYHFFLVVGDFVGQEAGYLVGCHAWWGRLLKRRCGRHPAAHPGVFQGRRGGIPASRALMRRCRRQQPLLLLRFPPRHASVQMTLWEVLSDL